MWPEAPSVSPRCPRPAGGRPTAQACWPGPCSAPVSALVSWRPSLCTPHAKEGPAPATPVTLSLHLIACPTFHRALEFCHRSLCLSAFSACSAALGSLTFSDHPVHHFLRHLADVFASLFIQPLVILVLCVIHVVSAVVFLAICRSARNTAVCLQRNPSDRCGHGAAFFSNCS